MNFVEPIITPIPSSCNSSPESIMKVVERAYRICYKSEANMKEGSEELIGRILHGGEKGKMIHSSPLEHRRIRMSCEEWIAEAIKGWQTHRGTSFITIDPKPVREGSDDNHVCYLEGNLRAFFDFIKNVEGDINIAILPAATRQDKLLAGAKVVVNNELNKYFPIIFEKIDSNECDANDAVRYIGESGNYMSFHVITTRDILQEIAHNRTISPNVESTRYCNYNKKGMTFCIPRPYMWTGELDWDSTDFADYVDNELRPHRIVDSKDEKHFIIQDGKEQEVTIHSETRIYEEASASTMIQKIDSMKDLYLFMTKVSEEAYNRAISLGCKPQEARMLLLGALKTEIILTGTFNDWAHFLKLRNDSAAHPQMIYIAQKIEKWFEDNAIPIRSYDKY